MIHPFSFRDREQPRLRGDVLVILGLLIIILAYFTPLFAPGTFHRYIVEGDFSHQFFPFRAFAAREWWQGRIPLWNPDMFAGHPFEADVQTAVFYPFAAANALLWGWHGLPYLALEVEVVVHTALAAGFMYLLARRLTGSRLGGGVAGLAFALSGFLTTYPAQQLPILESAVWLPLIVLALHEATRTRLSWAWLLGASAAFGLALLAGHTQTALFIAYATEGYLFIRLILLRDWRAAPALLLYPGAAILIAAVQVLPSAQLLTMSTRDQMDYAVAAHGYLISSLPQIFVPLWHQEKALSVGISALFLAVVGAWAGRREPLLYWTVVGLVAIPLSTGGATPLFWILYRVAPGWNLFRDQERAIYLFAFAASLLAGRGARELARHAGGTPPLKRQALLTWSALAAGGAVAALFLAGYGLNRRVSARLEQNLVLDAAALGLLGLFILAAARRQHGRLLAVALVTLVVGEAFLLNFGNNLSPVNPDPRPRLEPTAAFIRGFGEPFRIDATSEKIFPSDYGALLGLPTISGDTPFELSRMHDLMNSDAGWHLSQILNVKYVIGDPAPTPGLKLVFEDHGLKTYQMLDSLPRAWAVRAIEVARDPPGAKRLITAPGFHPGNVVVLEQTPAIGPFAPGPRPDVRITLLSPQRIDIDARGDGNAMLVLAQQDYPGWQATRDGVPIPTFRANDVAMAFELPPGTHHYEIVYRPIAFYGGAVLSALALVVVALVALATPRGRTIAALIRPRPALGSEENRQRPRGEREGFAFAVATGLLILGAFCLRLHALGQPNLTNDEWFMLRNHDEGAAWIIHQARTFEPHPLLYYLGLAGWIELAGRSEFAMRFPSAAFDVLLVPALIGIGRAVLGRRAGLVAGALAAINPYQIAESQNARNYAMVSGLSALATLLFLRAVRRGERGAWVAYGFVTLLALNTHYDAALVLVGHAAYLAARSFRAARTGRLAKHWATEGRYAGGALAVVTVLFLAMIAYALPGLRAYHGYFPTPVGLDRVIARSLATFSLGPEAPIRRAAPFFGLAAVGIAWLGARRRDLATFLGLSVGLPFALVGVLFLFRPMFDERYLIVVAPVFLLLVAAGVEASSRRFALLGFGVAAVAVGFTLIWLPRTYATELNDRPDYRAMAEWVATYGSATDPVVATGHGQAELFGYYNRGLTKPTVLDDPATLRARLPVLLSAQHGLWLLPYANDDADRTALDVLGTVGAPVAERWFNNSHALYFASTDGLARSSARARFGGALDLTGATATSGEVEPGDAVAVTLHWAIPAPIPSPKLSLRLIDADGEIIAQHDALLHGGPNDQSPLQPGGLTTRLGLFVPAVTPPGAYRVAILLYRPTDGQALSVSGHAATESIVSVGQIQVAPRQRPVPPSAYDVPAVAPVGVASGLDVVGLDPLPGQGSAGDWLSFRILWRAGSGRLPPVQRVVVFRDISGHSVATLTDPILARYPTPRWRPGQVFAEPVRLRIPPTLQRGVYAVALATTPGSGAAVPLGSIAVSAPDRAFAPPPVLRSFDARFGDFGSLLGVNFDQTRVAPGNPSKLTLVWAALAPADRRYTVFVHLVGPDGRLHGQIDRPPLGGGRPTDSWVAGEYLSDAYAPIVAADAPPGSYQIEVGMYDPATGVRVPVVLKNGVHGDHLIVGTFEVRR